MKLVLTLLVRNEEDIIRENILYHFSMGVDEIIVTDNNSEDNTLEILREFEKKGNLKIIIEKEDDYSQWKWVTRMARMAIEDLKADWVIHSDADEFWWPEKGNLKGVLTDIPSEFPVVSVPRFDFIPRPESDGPMFERMVYKDLMPVNHIGKPLPPKVCHRAIPGVVVGQGNHKLTEPAGLPVFRSPDLEILHFPMRSYEQFRKKIAFGGAAYERNTNLSKNVAMGWRILYEEYKKGLLPDYYNSKVLTNMLLEEDIKRGRYVKDVKLKEYLSGKNIINY